MPRANTVPSVEPANPAEVKLSPIVAAMLESQKNRKPFGERILNASAAATATATLVSGRLFESQDAERFQDGRKAQRVLNMQSRSDYWRKFGSQHGLTDEDVAAIIASS